MKEVVFFFSVPPNFSRKLVHYLKSNSFILKEGIDEGAKI